MVVGRLRGVRVRVVAVVVVRLRMVGRGMRFAAVFRGDDVLDLAGADVVAVVFAVVRAARASTASARRRSASASVTPSAAMRA